MCSPLTHRRGTRLKHPHPRTLKEDDALAATVTMVAEKKPRVDLVDNDPFEGFGQQRFAHSKTRDDGGWRQQQTSTRVVQVQFSPFTRGFSQFQRPPPTMHTGTIWHFSRQELKDLALAWACFSFGLSLVFQGGLFRMLGNSLSSIIIGTIIFFIIASIAFGPAFILHELAHKWSARRFGCWAEFRADPRGLRTGLIIAALFGFLFMAPGAVMVAGNVDRRQNGIISLAGPATNLLLWVLVLPLVVMFGSSPSLLVELLWMWLAANAILGGFNMLPFGPLDGRKIKAWSEPVFWCFIAIFIGLVYLSIFGGGRAILTGLF